MATEAGRAVLTIDLEAVVRNWRRLCAEAKGSTVGAVVKANGYGLGACEVAGALYAAGCDHFFVAHLEEGLTLRPHLAGAVIHVLHGIPPGATPELAEADLVPVLNQPGELRSWAELARARGARLPAVLQVDTGMCRLGLDPPDLDTLDAADLTAVELRFVMSHLACAEYTEHPLNERQRARFEGLRRHFPGIPASFANSSGIFLGNTFHYDLCRPGVALYGVNPTPGRPNPMAPVVTLEAPVLQVHEVRAHGSVGYGATYATAPGARIATVPVGYADGYLRAAGPGGRARIAGREVPLAGRVSMDLITLDVSALPDGAVRPGTRVELIGGPDGVDRVAAAAGTIGYEVLTRLGSRFARRYTPAGPGTRSA